MVLSNGHVIYYMIHLSPLSDFAWLAEIDTVATDVDGTLTDSN